MLPYIIDLLTCPFFFTDNNQLESVPSEIGKLSNLLDLDLSKLNDCVFQLSLTAYILYLTTGLISSIGNNKLQSLPTKIGNLSNLQMLDLSELVG